MQNIRESNFTRLIGKWKTTGKIISDGGHLDLSGTDSYEIALSGNYILHKADVQMGEARSETLELIKPGNSPDEAIMQYFNSKGEEGQMESSIIENEFRIEGEGLRFEGTIDDENKKIRGKWYVLTDDEIWKVFIELCLDKQAE